MKKYFYLSAAALATLFATSCSSDDVPAPVDGDLTTFQVQLPDELTTRFGEGTTAQKLCVAIYKHGDTTGTPLFTSFGDTTTKGLDIVQTSAENAPFAWTVSVPLVKEMQYDIVFWAQAPNAPFEFAPGSKTITVNYAGMTNFQEGRDAFFAKLDGFTSKGMNNDDVQLKRPFSQINIGTADYDKYIAASGVTAPEFAMSVSGINNTLNLLTGEVGLDETKLTEGQTLLTASSTLTAKNTDNLIANNNSYSYLGMAYVLAGGVDSQLTVDVNLYVNTLAGKFASYDNVPVQMNYRTNIYGDLLTNTETFNVEITPDFAGENIDLPQTLPAGHALVNGIEYNNLQNALDAAAENAYPVLLAPSTYDVKSIKWPQSGTMKLIGVSPEKTVINNLEWATTGPINVEISNVTLTSKVNKYNHTSMGFKNIKNAKYDNVTFNSEYNAYASESETFNKCRFNYNADTDPFNNGRHNIYYQSPGSMTINNCTFNNKYNSAIQINDYMGKAVKERNLTINNCTFTAAEFQYEKDDDGNFTDVAKESGAIKIQNDDMGGVGGTVIINNSTCNDKFQHGLYYEIHKADPSDQTKLFTIIVDGEVKQTPTK